MWQLVIIQHGGGDVAIAAQLLYFVLFIELKWINDWQL